MWKFTRISDLCHALSILFYVMRKKEFENNRDSKCNAIRVSPHIELEQNLVNSVHIMSENKISLSRAYGAKKAMEFAKAMVVTNFVASAG